MKITQIFVISATLTEISQVIVQVLLVKNNWKKKLEKPKITTIIMKVAVLPQVMKVGQVVLL